MGLSVKVGSFNTGLSTAAISVTCGFQPRAVVFWWAGRTEAVNTQGEGIIRCGVGFGVSDTDRRCATNTTAHASGNADTQSGHSDAACVMTVSSTPGLGGALDMDVLANWPADGFKLLVDAVFPIDLRVHFLALGGSDIANAVTGAVREPAVSGSQDTTTPGFQPDCVLFLASGSQSAPPSAEADSLLSFGAASSATDQAVWASASNDGLATMDTYRFCQAGKVVVLWSTAGTTIVSHASLSSMLSNGFQLSWGAVNTTASEYVHYLALKGGRYKVGDVLTQTNTTNFTETGVGFQPAAALFVSHGGAADAGTTPSAQYQLCLGAATGPAERAAAAAIDKDAVTTSDCATAAEYDEAYVNQFTATMPTTIIVQGLMDLVSFDSDGMTLVMDDADPAQAFVWYLAVGPAAAAFAGDDEAGLTYSFAGAW